MTKVEVVYLEVDHGGEETTIESKEETFHGAYLPRRGEEVYIGGVSRTVVEVKHYKEWTTVFAYTTSQYEYLPEDAQQAMDRLGLSPDESAVTYHNSSD